MPTIGVNTRERVASYSPLMPPGPFPKFASRKEAGQKLARALEKYKGEGPLILAIPPRGGEVGYEVAKYLEGDFSLLFSRKLPLPDNPQTGFGAIAEDGSTYFHVNLTSHLAPEVVQTVKKEQLEEIQRAAEALKSKRILPEISGRTVILVNDGLAKSSTMKAAFLLCRKRGAAKIIVAAPVIWKKAMEEIKWVADEMIALESPDLFYRVTEAYDNWAPVSDEEILNILDQWENFRNFKGR